MLIRKNKFLVTLVDFIANAIFFIPLCLEKKRVNNAGITPKKILIVELWGIGDLVMMSSVLRPLKARFPAAKIYLLGKPVAGELFNRHNHIDEMIFFDFLWTKFRGKYKLWQWNWNGLWSIIKRLRGEKFDLAIDGRGDLRNNILLFLSGAKQRLGYACLGGGSFLTDQISCSNNAHRVDKWAKIISYLGITNIDIMPLLQLKKEELDWADNFLRQSNIPKQDLVVGIHPGAGNRIRRWPQERFEEVAVYLQQAYKARILFFTEAQDENTKNESHRFTIVKAGLRQLAALFSKVDFLICNDSGPMHIATAVNTPVIAIFGPGEKEVIGPYGDNNVIIQKDSMPCRPCYDYCRKTSNTCLDTLEVSQVISEVDKITNKLKSNDKNRC